MLRPAGSLPAQRCPPPVRLSTPRSDAEVSPRRLRPATGRSGAYRDGTSTRWSRAAWRDDSRSEVQARSCLTDAELRRWLCIHAQVGPRPRRRVTLNVTGTHITLGARSGIWSRGARLVFTWLFDHLQPPIPTTVEVTLKPLGRGTRVPLHQLRLRETTHCVTATSADGRHYLPRLAAAAASGADPAHS